MSQRPGHIRAVCAWGLGTVSVSATALGAAMLVYPGGTWTDRSTIGHRFWDNFLCDLLPERSVSGTDNRMGACWAMVGVVAFACAAMVFAHVLSMTVADDRRARTALYVSGAVSAVGACALAVLPADQPPVWIHPLVVFGASLPACLCMALGARSLQRAGMQLGAALGALAFAATTFDIALYLIVIAGAERWWPMLPAVQRVAMIAVFSWLFAVFAHGVLSPARIIRRSKPLP